jgi:hypothetical protein
MFTNMIQKDISGKGDFTVDAWGKQKVTSDYSLFHGMWTFDIPKAMWIIEEDNVEVVNTLSTRATSNLGRLYITSGANAGEKCTVESRRHPRYQPNRGMLYSTSVGLPNPTANGVRRFGLITNGENGMYFKLISTGLYACILNDGVETAVKIDIPWSNFDLSKGNIYDIQAQWRGVGNIRFGIGNPSTGEVKEVYKFDFLGKLDKLSIRNPAMSIGYHCENITDEVAMWSGCVDVTSEGGGIQREQYGEATAAVLVSSGGGILAIRNPMFTPNGKINTRDVRLARFILSSNKKVTIKGYRTRNANAVVGGSWSPDIGASFVERNSTMTSVNLALMEEFATISILAGNTEFRDNPSEDTIDFFLVHGDHIVLVCETGASADIDATIEYGVEI